MPPYSAKNVETGELLPAFSYIMLQKYNRVVFNMKDQEDFTVLSFTKRTTKFKCSFHGSTYERK